jgi:uncharacterized protein GlcG (DUF336 family)
MSIRLAEANRAIQAALAKAHNLAINISVTVCDADGRLVAFQRMDGSLAEAHRASYGKALEPIREVWIHDEAFAAASRLSMMRIMAKRTNAATVVA